MWMVGALALDVADEGGEHGSSELAEQEGTEEDTLVCFSGKDAAILAAEANRTMAEARAANEKVRASPRVASRKDAVSRSASRAVASLVSTRGRGSLPVGPSLSMRSTTLRVAAPRWKAEPVCALRPGRARGLRDPPGHCRELRRDFPE